MIKKRPKWVKKIKLLSTGKRAKRLQAIDRLFKLRQQRNEYLKRLILEEDRVDLLVELAGYRYDDVHHLLVEYQYQNKKTLQLAPRGWGKTTVGTCLKIVHKILKDRNRRHLIASETATLAWDMLSEIKSILVCEDVAEVFGDLRGDVWHESAINIAGRTTHAKEKTVNTCGADGAVTGGHFDEIDADDLVSFKTSRTMHSRQKILDWFRLTLLPTVTDQDTEIHVKGTCYHPEDLYAHLRKNDPKFRNTVQIIPALSPINEESNNPEWYPTDFLVDQRESMGTPFFNAQYNQDPSGVQGEVFDAEHFRHCETLPKRLLVFSGVDLAVGREDAHDCFAIVTIGVDPKTLDIYVLSYRKAKLTIPGQNELMLRKSEIHNPIRMGVESNAYQRAKIQELKSHKRFRKIPAVPIYTREDKITRAQRLAARYERGEIWHLKSEKDGELEADLVGFPDVRYKDLVDALDIAIQAAFRKKKKRVKRNRKIGVIGGRKWDQQQVQG